MGVDLGRNIIAFLPSTPKGVKVRSRSTIQILGGSLVQACRQNGAWHRANGFAGREVHLLYPWLRSVGGNHRPYRHGITNGKGKLNLNLRYIEVTNVGPGETAMAPHSAATVRISNLPTGPSQFHVTLGP